MIISAGVDLSELETGALIALGSLLIASFLLGAYFTQKLVTNANAFSPRLHALAIWAGVVVLNLYLLTAHSADIATQYGIGGLAAIQTNALVEQLAELKPRLETDMKLLDGKAVTTLIINPNGNSLSAEIAESAKDEG